MDIQEHSTGYPEQFWLVGGIVDGIDRRDEFIRDGIWEATNDTSNYLSRMQVGDRIAIKSSYTRKHGLPFDVGGKTVSCLGIQATGVITKVGSGYPVEVQWEPASDRREWYFFVDRSSIWPVTPHEWKRQALYDFVFRNIPQDCDRFRNEPFWKERYGQHTIDSKFPWIPFYRELASKLVAFADNRQPLASLLHEISNTAIPMQALNDQQPDGTMQLLADICPFTFAAMFNRGLSDANRAIIAQAIADSLGITAKVPTTFPGIPVVNNQNTWFFSYASKRKPDDIDKLWKVFLAAYQFEQNGSDESQQEFVAAYNQALAVRGVAWNLTMGLFWFFPELFMPLDGRSRNWLTEHTGLKLPNQPLTADDYLAVNAQIEQLFQEEGFPAKSFPELSLLAWKQTRSTAVETDEISEVQEEYSVVPAMKSPQNIILYGPPGTGKTYRLQDLTKQYTLKSSSLTREQWLQDQLKDDSWFEVVFMCMYDLHNKGPVKAGDVEEHPFYVAKAQVLGRQKNLRAQVWAVLQTHTLESSETVKYSRRVEPQVFDKTEQSQWVLAGNWQEETAHLIKRAAYLQSGQPLQEERKNYELVTFHQAYSYEDFVEGLRPEYNEEKASLEYLVKPGIFWQICHKAKLNPDTRYAIFIDEINRGNIAQIFGELITLIETDKRAVYDHDGQLVSGMELTLPYSQTSFGVPRNLDIYGSMNTADRSIALLDTALRRRFRFEELMPKSELIEGADGAGCIDDGLGGVIDLRQLLNVMNQRIEFLLHRDLTLGHAYFCQVKTFNQLCGVMTQQVIPLLQEYFYNDWQRIQLVFNDIQSGDRPVEPQIIQHKIWSAGDVLGSEQDEDFGESRSYWVNPILMPESFRKIYQKSS